MSAPEASTPVLGAEDNTMDLKDYPHPPNLPLSNPQESNSVATLNPAQTVKPKPSSRATRFVGYTLRTILLDLPLLAILLTFASALWLHHVYDHYLEPQLDALLWTEVRAGEEVTYYERECDSDDLTSDNSAELFLPMEATPEEAYQHQLLHGFTVFPSVLTDETANHLRNFVLSKNRNLTADENIFVIAGQNRFSFGLGTEEPSVTAAMMELARNERLRPSLEKVLGENPSLIEMTAITSSYGAEAQYWHDDVIPTASAIKYARSFGPSYSVFIQLQNTTKEMGATAACPGTHYCSAGQLADVCEHEGFQLVGEDGKWKIGDALLMNMNSYHRGAAHIDPDGEDRVMLILTFAPQPKSRAESRQMSQGITFSLRWDMWGHTLSDLANADTAMAQPWATLRALGLFKLPGSAWGIDYISGGSMRMSNGDNGFSREELDDFLDRGGFKGLPQFLHAKVADDESWPEFCRNTVIVCEEFAKKVSAFAVAGYFVLFTLIGLLSGKPHRVSSIGRALGRLLFVCTGASLVFWAARRHVDNTDWAADIRQDLRYSSAVSTEEDLGPGAGGLPTTLPTRHDVLIETRHGSDFLALYNDFIDGHPGNRVFKGLLEEGRETYIEYPEFLRQATARFVSSSITAEGGRFLLQGFHGDWHVMDEQAVTAYVKRELLASTIAIMDKLRRAVAFISSDYKYGIYRHTAMAKHAVPFLRGVEARFLGGSQTAAKQQKVKGKKSLQPSFQRFLVLGPVSTGTKPEARKLLSRQAFVPEEPYEGAWLKSGDDVEAFFEGHWYLAKLELVTAHGFYTAVYPDGTDSILQDNAIRLAEPYEPDEEVEVQFDDPEIEGPDGTYYRLCEIVEHFENGAYHVVFEDGRHYAGYTAELFRREGRVYPKGVYEAAY